uniref:Uncharacterized protein n=1 Tax=viral metagenome TaxID=1070528 RepID=A0A6H1ZKZ3_9ZZZZ
MTGISEGRPVKKRTFLAKEETDLTLDDTTYCGEEINCERYNRFLFAYEITETGQLAGGDRIRWVVQFREPNGTWHDYYNGPFGALFEEESTTPCAICVSGICLGERMRICVTTDYTNADPTSNYFTVIGKVTLVESG